MVGCQTTKQAPKSPNIIVILLDDLGYGDFSIYAEANKIKTPHIDQIAKEGIYFTDAHTPSSVCTPTRYGLLTGRYNWRSRLKNGVLTGKSKALIPNDRTTIASILQSSGYHTAFIGKWHLGWDWALRAKQDTTGEGWNSSDFDFIDFAKPVTNTPNDLGFDYSYGHSGSLDMAPYVYVENGQATALPDTVTVNTGKYSWWREGPTSPDFIHEQVTPNFFEKGIQYIQEQSEEPNPFFLYLPMPSPHTPILPTQKWQGSSGLNPYADFVLMIDDYIGQIAATLETQGIAKETLLIITSDNGCSPAAKMEELIAQAHYPSGEFRGHKADIFEGGHRVPFIARWPAKIKAGSVTDQTICLTDLMATFSAIVGYDLQDNEGEDSYNLLPILENNALDKTIRPATVHHSINGSFAIRQGHWKLIMCPGSGGWSFPRPQNKAVIDTLPPVQLYNLENDPGESTNLEAESPEKVKELKALLVQYIKEGRSTPGLVQKNDDIDFIWKQAAFAFE
ncbi:MAG: arylsulfatase [Saprospiraceae bacterium]